MADRFTYLAMDYMEAEKRVQEKLSALGVANVVDGVPTARFVLDALVRDAAEPTLVFDEVQIHNALDYLEIR